MCDLGGNPDNHYKTLQINRVWYNHNTKPKNYLWKNLENDLRIPLLQIMD